ncbi:MAG: DoxX family membrane protein [Propionibacteriaceae bacterium]|jgi:uncharacterized membrane protein YphA (DoxX/SURF4 family)|nr:DoxX family membrane protein [Propionibacteriaceae bacterium]
MSLLRFAGRSLLASYFIGRGLDAARQPDRLVDQARPWADQASALIERFAPPALSAWAPDQTRTWVRYHGLAEVAAGLMVASGVGRRLGATGLVLSQICQVASLRRSDQSSETDARGPGPLAVNLALLGAALIEALDHQGRPDRFRRARRRQPRRKRSEAQR